MFAKGSRLYGLAAGLAVLVFYFIAGKFGLSLAFVNSSASAVWPPTGIAIAVLLVLGYGFWPAIFLGAFLVNFTTTGFLPTSVAIAIGNVIEGLLGAYLINKYAGGLSAFDRWENIFKFVFLAAFLSTVVSATIGVTSLVLFGLASAGSYLEIWFTWWMGDFTGALIVTPALVLFYRRPGLSFNRRTFEVAFTMLAMVLAMWFGVFGNIQPFAGFSFLLTYVGLISIVWMALRYGQRDVALATIILSAVAILGTLRGYGPFVRMTPNDSLLYLQVFLGVISILGLTVSASTTERRESERNLNAKNAELAGSLAALRWETSRRERSEGKVSRMAAVDAAKKLMLSLVGHELKSPMTPIKAQLQMLARGYLGKLNPEQRKAVDVVERNANRLDAVVSEFIDVASLESTRLRFNYTKADLAPFVKSLVADMQGFLGEKNVRITARIGKLPRAVNDPGRTMQVLRNLIINAKKFSPENSTVVVTAKSLGSAIQFGVMDRGIGIKPGNEEKVFAPFFQEDQSASRRYGGMGLGLTLCRGIVEAQGGRIWCEANKPGRGTTFHFTVQVSPPKRPKRVKLMAA